MKGYNKKLKNFIEYVLNKYAKDESVSEFRDVYLSREREREERKQAKKLLGIISKSVKITKETADICAKLVKGEIVRNELMGNYTAEFMEKLHTVNDELSGVLDVSI